MASPVVGAEGSRVERARKSGWRPVSGAPRAWSGAPVGVRDSAVVAVGVAGGVSAGLVPPGLGLPSSGVGLRSSGVGEAEAVAVDVSVGVPVGGCATETAAPTTVSSAAAAQMIWARRRKLATMRRRSATMERTIGRGRWRRITTLRTVVRGCARPDRASYRSSARSPRRLVGDADGVAYGLSAVGARSVSGARRLVARWSGRGVRCGLSLFGRCR